MWAVWPAVIILGLLGVVGGFYTYKQRRMYIDAKVRWEYETTSGEPSSHSEPDRDDARRPKAWAVVLAAVIVFGLLAAAVGLLVSTIANS
jgi:uncharacterized iron-regulated membrane protein